jgi:Xaa-Pro aminopeptidase
MFEAKFQTFDVRTEPAKAQERVAALRAELAKRKLDGFLVPRADEYQNEYVPACEDRLGWLTGFAGSAGIAVVLADKAALFVDGRYTTEARAEIDQSVFAIEHLIDHPPEKWLAENLKKGAAFGYDPARTTIDGLARLKKACEQAGATLYPADSNPVDAIWADRPPPPLTPVMLRDLRYAGEASEAKLSRIREALKKEQIDAAVLSDPASVAWTFNIRGHDVAHTPLPLSWAIVPRDGTPGLFVDSRKLSNTVRDALTKLATIDEPTQFIAALRTVAGGGRTIRIDQAEIAGMREAHKRDGAALARFLAWLDREAAKGKLTEIDAVKALETFRRDTGELKDVSFPTIAGAGPDGAIVHYRVSEKSNRRLAPGELFLVDSGAQYEDGTTDVTRTIAIGDPNHEMRERFTLVLKGHIAIARAIFPEGTSGAQIDAFARAPLWAAGFDYDHGTGHGIGSYLSVHEGPARLSKLGTAALAAGMVLSIEPGYYKPGAYGIRTENLALVAPLPAPKGAEKNLLGFEALTLAPIDRRLILPSRLSLEELDWLDRYHARVREMIAPLVDAETRSWLDAATAPLIRQA